MNLFRAVYSKFVVLIIALLPTGLSAGELGECDASRPTIKTSVRTNALFDFALVPNLGIEVFTRNESWSFGLDWDYAWWNKPKEADYYSTYGGNLYARRWLGIQKRHHIGVYGQLISYDFEFGNDGRQALPFNYGGGVEYGYCIPLAKRFSLDLLAGVGYVGGKYKEYHPENTFGSDTPLFVWDRTIQGKWIGPTKLQVAFVWSFWDRNETKKRRTK